MVSSARSLRVWFLAGFCLLLLPICRSGYGQEAGAPALPGRRYDPHTLLVKFRGGFAAEADEVFAKGGGFVSRGAASVDALLVRNGVSRCEPVFRGLARRMKTKGTTEAQLQTERRMRFAGLANRVCPIRNLRAWHTIRLADGIDPEVAAAEFRKDPNVEAAHPDYTVRPCQEPNDELWGGDPSWGLRQIDAPEAWDITTGSDQVIVAVIDSGVDLNHEDLRDQIWQNDVEMNGESGVDDDENGYVDDYVGWNFFGQHNTPYDEDGHGTKMAGIIGARGNNDRIGCVGVNWNVRILPLDISDNGSWGTVSHVAEALEYVVAHRARVANISLRWYSESLSPGSIQVITDAVYFADASNVVVCVGAGNEGRDAAFAVPANLMPAITVAASDQNDNRAVFPGWWSSNYGSIIDVSAPGVDCMTTYRNNQYGLVGGTSAATAFTSGVCALLLAQDDTRSSYQIAELIRNTAEDIEDPGFDIWSGYGRINARRALLQYTGSPVAEITSPDAPDLGGIPDAGIPVIGTAKSSNDFGFRYYELGLWHENDLAGMIQLNHSVSPVTDGELGRIPKNLITAAGQWKLQLHVSTDYGDLWHAVVGLIFFPPQAGVRRLGTNLSVYTGPKVVDLDLDGVSEIVIAPFSTQVWVLDGSGNNYDANGDGTAEWPVETGQLPSYATHPAVGNVDADPELEIVVARRDVLQAYNHDGTLAWSINIASQPHFNGAYKYCRPGLAPALADLNGDGRLDIVVSYECFYAKSGNTNTYRSSVFAFNGAALTSLSGWPKNFSMTVVNSPINGLLWSGERAFQAPAVGDLDGNGALEVVYLTRRYWNLFGNNNDETLVYAWNANGSVKWSEGAGGRLFSRTGSPSLIDVDGNGTAEAAFFESGLAVFNGSTGGLTEIPLGLGYLNFTSPSCGRIGGGTGVVAGGRTTTNGSMDVALRTSSGTNLGFAYVDRSDESNEFPADDYEIPYSLPLREDLFADVSGDSDSEVISNERQITHLLGMSGGTLAELGNVISETVTLMFTTPAVGDVTGDGKNDLVIADRDGAVWIVPTASSGTADWACWGADVANTRCTRALRRPVRLEILPSSVTMGTGATQIFSVCGYDQYGDPIQPSVSFSATAGSFSETIPGLYIAPSTPGTVTITATSGAATASATVTVQQRVITYAIVSPEWVELSAYGSQSFTATAYDQFGSPLPATFQWQTYDEIGTPGAGGRVTSAGLYTAPLEAGNFAVSCTVNEAPGIPVSSGSVRVRLEMIRAYAHDTSRRGTGVQSGDRLVLFFNGATNRYSITASNISQVLLLPPGRSWGSILSAQWFTAAAPPGYLWGGYGLVITFGGSGTVLAAGDEITVAPNTITGPPPGMTAPVPPPAYGGRVSQSFDVWIRGDMNGDGAIDILDVVEITNRAFRAFLIPPSHLWTEDLNNDGVVDIIDVVMITNIAFRGWSYVPFPSTTTSTKMLSTDATTTVTRGVSTE